MGSVDYEVWLWVKSLVIGECGLRCLVVGKSMVTWECGLRGLVVGKVTGSWGVWITRYGCG